MAADPNAIEQAVSRTLRDNLEKIQRTVDELHQSVNDLVSACASSRPSNALPPMVRAQTSAASLSATLDVLSRFVTGALQPPMRSPFEPEILHMPSHDPPMPVTAFEQPEPVARASKTRESMDLADAGGRDTGRVAGAFGGRDRCEFRISSGCGDASGGRVHSHDGANFSE